MKRLIAKMLHVANASAPWPRDEFYAMKDKICRRFGELVGYDVQFITDKCWGNDWWSDDPPGCTHDAKCKCGGSGLFNYYWVRLERWEIAGRIFHRPIDRRLSNPWGAVTIEGRIRHESHGYWGRECAMWLALAFDRRLFWQMFNDGGTCFGRMPPLCFLHSMWSRLKRFGRRFKRHECNCGRHWRDWFGDTGWMVCRKCRNDGKDGIPF